MRHEPHFNGSDYVPSLDFVRLSGQIEDIRSLMIDGEWRSLGEIEDATGHGQASISAQLRHLRKERFGRHIVEKRRRSKGLFEYRVLKWQGKKQASLWSV